MKTHADSLYVNDSKVSGYGLFSSENLPAGSFICIVSEALYPMGFIDAPYGRFINHDNKRPNVDLFTKSSKRGVFVCARTSKDVASDQELVMDYNHDFCPRPNFAAPLDIDYWQRMFGRKPPPPWSWDTKVDPERDKSRILRYNGKPINIKSKALVEKVYRLGLL